MSQKGDSDLSQLGAPGETAGYVRLVSRYLFTAAVYGVIATICMIYGAASSPGEAGTLLGWFCWGTFLILVPMSFGVFSIMRAVTLKALPITEPFNRNRLSFSEFAPRERAWQLLALGLTCLIINQPPELIGVTGGLWFGFTVAFGAIVVSLKRKEGAAGRLYWVRSRWWTEVKPGERAEQRAFYSAR